MIVYLVLQHIPYEGSEVLGVYLNQEKADAEVARLTAAEGPNAYVGFSADPWEVLP